MRPINNTPQQLLSEKFSGIIWKLKTHRSGVIAVETRNPELKHVLFSAFNFITGETYFKEKAYEESWNLSLAFAGEKNLILNAYEHSDTPESRGVLSVSLEQGKVIWQKFHISLNQVQDAALQVYDSKLQPRKLYWLDHHTAEVTDEPISDPVETDILFPEIRDSFNLPSFFKHGIIAGEFSFLSCFDKVFLSFHEVEGDFLKQRLIVYQGDKILIDDILISGIQKLQPEAFFIQQNHLLYIRNKGEIISYFV